MKRRSELSETHLEGLDDLFRIKVGGLVVIDVLGPPEVLAVVVHVGNDHRLGVEPPDGFSNVVVFDCGVRGVGGGDGPAVLRRDETE